MNEMIERVAKALEDNFMGYTAKELAKIISEFQLNKYSYSQIYDLIPTIYSSKKEKKMTREEALNILIKRQEFDASILKVRTSETERKELAKNELETLEALALIKFDEPKRKYIFFPHPDEGKDNVSVYQDDAIKTFKEYGYIVGKEHEFVVYNCDIPN